MNGPIEGIPVILTQKYKGNIHMGVDVRSYDFKRWKLCPIVATEQQVVIRVGIDGYGNDYIICRPFDDTVATELKYIHVKPSVSEGDILAGGQRIGITAIDSDYSPRRGNSYAHHLHFETWKGSHHFDPVLYFSYGEIEIIGKSSRA
jgi:murein DD-endopeptidase MepM/ murein hydrolase activator NlpD